jgi:hypothetical protein
MAIPNRAIADAWAAMKPDIDKAFGGDVTKLAIPPQRQGCSDLGLCRELNPPPSMGQGSRPWSWQAKGEGVVVLDSLAVTRLEGVNAKAAEFTGDGVLLPIDFDTMEVRGRYRISVPCVQVTSLAGEIGSQEVVRQGDLTEVYVRGTLFYHLNNGDKLAFTRASMERLPDYSGVDLSGSGTVVGTPVMGDGPGGKPDQGRLGYVRREVRADRNDGAWLMDLLSGRVFGDAWLGAAMASSVQAAEFSQAMIAALTARLELTR